MAIKTRDLVSRNGAISRFLSATFRSRENALHDRHTRYGRQKERSKTGTLLAEFSRFRDRFNHESVELELFLCRGGSQTYLNQTSQNSVDTIDSSVFRLLKKQQAGPNDGCQQRLCSSVYRLRAQWKEECIVAGNGPRVRTTHSAL